jgi:ribosomal protein S18 acetylase RimI-like enzyme
MLMKHPHIELDYAFTIRHAELDDIELFYQLVKVLDAEFYGQTTTTKETLLTEWQEPGFDIARDTRLVFAPSGALIGFSILRENKEMPVRPYTWSYVHPDWRRLGVGTALIEWAQARAKENLLILPEDARLVLTTSVYETNYSGKELLETFGFTSNRTSVNFLIEMGNTPQQPTLPDGIRIITYHEFGDLRAVYRVLRDAFRDHRGFIDIDFEVAYTNFEHYIKNDQNLDFSVWFLAMDGDKLVGISLCAPTSWDDPHKGWVDELGVLREYRNRGIAKALLHHTFGEFYRRGFKKVGLNADGSNLTGAVQLYQSVGMRMFRTWHAYEKELRGGVEYSNQG